MKAYKIHLCGEAQDIDIVYLSEDYYSTQKGRNRFKALWAEFHGLSTRGMSIRPLGEPYIRYTDMETGEIHKKYV